MFDLSEKRLAWIIVSWPGLVQRDAGALAEKVEHKIELQVELVDQDRLDQLNDQFSTPALIAAAEDETPDQRKARRDLEVDSMLSLVQDWRGVLNAGQPVPFDRDNVARLVRVPGFAAGFNTAYVRALAGMVEEREKNSDGSPQPGQQDAAADKPQA